MKRSLKKYIDKEIAWVRDIKKTENYWLEKYLESEQKAQREATRVYNDSMNAWKEGHNEWKDRMEQLTAGTVTRRELRGGVVAALTIMLMFLGLLVAIFLKK